MKTFKFKSRFLILFVGLLTMCVTQVWAVEADYTLTPSAGSNNSYTGNCDVTVGGITWNIGGNAQQIPWRLGGKSITGVDRTVYSKTAYTSAVSQIDLTVGGASSITVNSLKLVYSTNANFSNSSEISKTFTANSTISFEGNFPANAYYKFVFNVTVSGSNNKFVEFSKVEIYNAAASIPYTVTFNAGTNGTCSTASSTEASAGAGVTLPSVTANTGYRFVGWSTSSTPTNANAGKAGDTYKPSANTTLYAYYVKTWDVKWYVNGVATTKTVDNGAALEIPDDIDTDIECGGKVFVGWCTQASYSNATTAPTGMFTSASGTVGANANYYAVFATASAGGADPTAYTAGNTGSYVLAIYNTSDSKWYALPTSPTVTSGKITGEEITVSTTASSVNYVTSANASGYTWTIANATNGQTISDGTNYIYHSNGGSSGTNLAYGNSTSYTWKIESETNGLTFKGMSGSTVNSRGMLASGTSFGGYALSNEDQNGYYRIQVLPIGGGSTYTDYITECVSCTDINPELSYTSTSLIAGGAVSSDPDLTGNTGSGAVRYTSSNTAVADVDATTGVVTPKAVGNTTITATIDANGGYCSGSAAVNFSVAAGPSLSIDHSALSGNATGSGTLTVTANNYGSNPTYEWSTSDPAVATVSGSTSAAATSSATVSYVGQGSATITCRASDGKTVTCAVTVSCNTLGKVSVTEPTYLRTTSAQLNWTAVPNASSYTIILDGGAPITNITTNKYSVTGLTPGTNHTFTVQAIGNGTSYCDGAVSLEKSFSTKISVNYSRQGNVTATELTSPYTLSTTEEDACSGWEFQGWTTETSVDGSSYSRVTTGVHGTTYYAVYGKTEGASLPATQYQETTVLTPGDYVIGAVKSVASPTLASNTQIGAIKFSTATASSSWGQYGLLTPSEDGIIENPDASYIYTLAESGEGYTLYNSTNKYISLGSSTGANSSGKSETLSVVYITSDFSTCKGAFVMKQSAGAENRLMCNFNSSCGYRMYGSGSTPSANLSPYIRFYRSGGGSTITYKTAPPCGPQVVATMANKNITSSTAQWVAGVSQLQIDATNLWANADAANITMQIECSNNNFKFADVTGGVTGQGASASTLTNYTNISDDTWSRIFNVTYAPTSANTTETATVTIRIKRYNSPTEYNSTSFTITGRSLPNQFVIAANVGGSWVAMSDVAIASGSSPDMGYPITVDNNSDPTYVTGTVPDLAVYSPATRGATFTTSKGTAMMLENQRWTGHYLCADANNTYVYIPTDKYADGHWVMESDDLKDYLIYTDNGKANGYYLTHRDAASGKEYIGHYRVNNFKLRLLPLQSVTQCKRSYAPVVGINKAKDATNNVTLTVTDTKGEPASTQYEYSVSGSGTWNNMTGTGTSATVTLTGLTKGTNYTYLVRAKSSSPACQMERTVQFTPFNPVVTIEPASVDLSCLAGSTANQVLTITPNDDAEGWSADAISGANASMFNFNSGTKTVTFNPAGGTADGTYTATLTIRSTSGTYSQNITLTGHVISLAALTMTMDNVSNGVICGENDVQYCRFNKAFYTTSAATTKLTAVAGLESSIFLRDLTAGTEEAVTNTSAHAYSLTDGVPSLSYNGSLLKTGHTYQFVYYNSVANGGAGYYAKEGGVGVAFADAETDPFMFVASCNKPNVLTPCVTSTSATLNWLDLGCTGSTSSSVKVYTKSETEVNSIDFRTTTISGKSSTTTIWCTSQNSSVATKSADYGYPLGTQYQNAIYSPTISSLISGKGITLNAVTELTVEITCYSSHTQNDLEIAFGLVNSRANSGAYPSFVSTVKFDGTTASSKTLTIPQGDAPTFKTYTFTLSNLTSGLMLYFKPKVAAKSSHYLTSVRILSVTQNDIAGSPFTVTNCGNEKEITGLTANSKYFYTITRGEYTTDEASFTTWKSGKTTQIEFGSAATQIYATGTTPATAEITVTGHNVTQEPILSGLTAPFSVVSNNLKYDCETGELGGSIIVQFTPGTSTTQTLTLATGGKNYTHQVISVVCPDYQSSISQTVVDDKVTINLGNTFSGSIYLSDNGNPAQNLLSNPGFEAATPTTDWGAAGYSGGAGYEISSSVKHSGSNSLLMKEYNTAGNLQRNSAKYYALYHAEQSLPKGNYSVTAWIRGVSQYTDAEVYIGASTGNGSTNLGQSNVTTIKGAGWVQLQCQFTVDKTKNVQVFVAKKNASSKASDRIYIDDFVLTGSTAGDPDNYPFTSTNSVEIDHLYPSHNYSYTVQNSEGCEWGPYTFLTSAFSAAGHITVSPSPVELSTTLNESVSGLMTIMAEYVNSTITLAKSGTNPEKFTLGATSVGSTGGSVKVTFNGQGVAGQTYTATVTLSATDIEGTPISETVTLRGTIAAGTSWSGPTVEVVDVDATHLTIEHNIPDATGANIFLSRELEGEEIVKNVGCELFFSKYYEAYANVKLWAIYNPTQEAIDLTDMYVVEAHAGKSDKGAIPWSSTSKIALAGLGKGKNPNNIDPDEEIIVYCPGNSGSDAQTIACAAGKADMSNWNSQDDGASTATAFNGNDALCLVRGDGNARYKKENYKFYDKAYADAHGGDLKPVTLNWRYIDWNDKEYEMIDLIGARTNSNLADNSKCVTPTFYAYDGMSRTLLGSGDDPGWVAKGHDMNGGEMTLSTNRCLLVREKNVKSGSNAVMTNVGDMATLQNEWQGAIVPTNGDQVEVSCANFSFVGDFNYPEYYNKYTDIDVDSYEFDTQNPDGTFTGTFAELEDYTCQNILIEVVKASNVGGVEVKETKASLEYKVPIIVDDNMATNGEKFIQFDDCSTCDVVVLNGQKLQTHNSGKNTVHNVTVYPGGNVLVNVGHTLSVNNMEIQSTDDQVAYAKVDGTLSVGNDLVHLKRIDALAWYPFALPYDCDMASIRQRNGKMLGTYGADWFIKRYDGAGRAETGTKNDPNHDYWQLVDAAATLHAYEGYIIGIGGINEATADEARRLKTVYFEPKNQGDSYSETATDTKSYPINGYTGAATEAGQLYDKGWNFVANPYVSIYQQSGTGLDNHTGLVMGYVQADGTYTETSNVYVYIPNDETKNTYYQYLATDTRAKMLPFRPYFVQAMAESGNTNTLTYNKSGRSLNVAAPARSASATEPSMVKIVATGENGQYDHLGIWVDNRFTQGYDELYDCMKMYAENYTQPQLFTYSKDGENMAMAYNAVADEDAIDLRMRLFMPQKGRYTLHIDTANSKLQNVEHVIVKKNNVVVADLTEGDYTIVNNTNLNRDNSYTLSVHRSARIATSINNNWNGEKPIIYSDGNGMNITNLPDGAKVVIFDMLGRCVATCPSQSGMVHVELPMTGVYNVSVSAGNGMIDIKTIVK